MSFSSEVKKELNTQTGSARHCQIAELAGIFVPTARIMVRKAKDGSVRDILLIFQTENKYVARKQQYLLKKTFGIDPECTVRRTFRNNPLRIYELTVSEKKTDGGVTQILSTLKREELLPCEGTLVISSLESGAADRRILRSDCCRRAFIRGAFLASGSISDPQKSYHFEIVCYMRDQAEQIREIINSYDMDAKIITRKKYFVVYVKESEQIADLLKVMGAYRKVLDLEDLRVLKDVRNNVNRKVNCETANSLKTVEAAQGQIDAILKIRDTMGMEALPENLRIVANVRLENPDVALQELGTLFDPPLSKSCVNHRLRKIREIAEEI